MRLCKLVRLLVCGFGLLAAGCTSMPEAGEGDRSATVRAIRYRFCGWVGHPIRFPGTIEEIFIPEYGVCFNHSD